MNPAAALRSRVAGRVLDDDAARQAYSRDQSAFRVVPRAVVVASEEGDVAATIEVCRDGGIPLTVRSGGTGLAGQSIGAGVILDVGGLPTQIEVIGDGVAVRTTASARIDAVNAALAPFGRRLGPDLTSSAEARVGGIVGTNACGAASHRYGRTADSVLEIEAVLGTGERVTLPSEPGADPGPGSRLPRAPSGYASGGEGARALCGSEGTLGVVLGATLATFVLPLDRAVGVVPFADPASAAEAVPDVLAHDPAAVEMLDRLALQGRWPDDPGAVLLVEMHADAPGAAIEALAAVDGIQTAFEGSGPDPAWALRRSILSTLMPDDGRRPVALIEDACVPIAGMPELVQGALALGQRLGVEIVVYGHAAGGTLHLRPLLDLRRQEHRRAAVALIADHADLVLALGGTVSSEHGLGLARSWLVPRELDAETFESWKALKRRFDPAGILNPGRVIPDRETFPADLLAP